jgi:sterol 3beta-glucosyltransferase
MISIDDKSNVSGPTVAVVASGSRGDVQPYVALGQALKATGYTVRMLASSDFESLATNAGLDFSSTGESIEAIVQSDEWHEILERGNFISILAKMQSEMKERAASLARHLPGLLKGSDLIITGMAGIGGTFTIAETLGIPVVQAYLFPFTPTHKFPAPLVPKLPLGKLLNRLSFHVTRQLFWQSTKVGDVATRRLLGLGKPSFFGPYRTLARRQVPALYGYSAHVLPKPHDWPENHHVCGYWFLDPSDDWSPPSDLVEFLDAGEPPVYIGFGSMGNRNPEETGNKQRRRKERKWKKRPRRKKYWCFIRKSRKWVMGLD